MNKISVYTPLSSYFRGKNLELTRLKINLLSDHFVQDSKKSKIQIGFHWQKQYATLDDVFIGNSILNHLVELKDFMVRVEGNTLNLYFNDDQYFDKFTSINGIRIDEINKPEDLKVKEYLLTNPKTIIRKNYTHKYKLTLAPLFNDSENFIQWANKLPKIKCASKSYKWGGQLYVADEKTLSLCQIYLSSKIRKVEKLVKPQEV